MTRTVAELLGCWVAWCSAESGDRAFSGGTANPVTQQTSNQPRGTRAPDGCAHRDESEDRVWADRGWGERGLEQLLSCWVAGFLGAPPRAAIGRSAEHPAPQ